VRNKN